jgi:sterol desaturase/sphingolipid hydroxylase (fatty acid hydroxylase superfamily)
MAEKQFKHNVDESPKMFENPFLDFFSRVHVAVIPVIFIPFIGYFIYKALFMLNVSALNFSGFFFIGIIIWTFFEYWFHRLVFHYKPSSDMGKRFIFMAHGIHHDYPNDSMRLVMPPVVSLGLAFIVYWVLFAIIRDVPVTTSVYAGFVFGYFVYDLTHYATHYSNYKGKWFQKIKKSHMLHHYQNGDKGYGLSNVFWDYVFGTQFPKK